MVNIGQAFDTENRSVFEHFQRPGVGFYIPLYQREYSWDKDNIEQLLEDITTGVEGMIKNPNDEIRFLGTIITVNDSNRINVQPKDPKAVPTAVEIVIDGQQRLSTISLLAMVLAQYIGYGESKIYKSINKLSISKDERTQIEMEVKEVCAWWQSRLHDVFSLDLKRGVPTRKPKIIRGSIDKWVMQDDNNSYNSPVSRHIADYISAFYEDSDFPKLDKKTNASRNLKMIEDWVKDIVVKAHDNNDKDYCDGNIILKEFDQTSIWQFERTEITDLLTEGDIGISKSFTYNILSIVQLFAACHYLLDRCCFTVIQPISDKWAFDMFQSLNATGTPLTAIETFKPLIINTLKLEKREFKNSKEDISFSKIETAFGNSTKAADKNKFTNDLITSFAIPVDAYRCPTHFSAQRSWLENIYDSGLSNVEERLDFLEYLGNYSEFYKSHWLSYKGEDKMALSFLQGNADANLASLLFLYLKDSSHRMSVTLLGTYYEYLLSEKIEISEYINLIKAIAAFYTIWRSAQSNSGLDEVYRSFFKENSKKNAWLNNRKFELGDVKDHFLQKLSERGIKDKESWIAFAKEELLYNKVPSVCKIALFITSHQTIPDTSSLGLMKNGSVGVNPFLTLERWLSDDVNTIEHVAPQTQGNGWDNSLYIDRRTVNLLGNLTILPLDLNASAGNRSWVEKLLYYKHVGNDDPSEISNLSNDAQHYNANLETTTLNRLKAVRFSSHIQPITLMKYSDNWDLDVINLRTERMLDILWDRIRPWLD